LKIQEDAGSFSGYLWDFVGGRPIRNRWRSLEQIPALTAESKGLSRDLIRRGATFVGPTICYAFMQATGLVNDHLVTCFRYEALRKRA
jgi:DNA-3-methyladenine glycosylase I